MKIGFKEYKTILTLLGLFYLFTGVKNFNLIPLTTETHTYAYNLGRNTAQFIKPLLGFLLLLKVSELKKQDGSV